MNKEEFISEVNKLGITLEEEKLNKLNRYYEILVEENKKFNLTAITDKEDVYLKHFYDSLTLVKAIALNQNLKVLDVGTGAGFPGIVLKIVFPNLKITLLDSLEKRIKYLNIVIDQLELKEMKTVCVRSEEYTKIHREEYDLVVSRAVAHLKILSEITFAAIKVNGYLIAMKGNVSEELKESLDIINKLNGKYEESIEFKLPKEESIRTLVKIKKVGKTNIIYPREYSRIKKEISKKR